MRPPICAICRKDFRKDIQKGGSIRFALSPEDQAFNDRMTERRQKGHPKGLEWFCNKHLPIAKRYKHLIWKEARPKIIKKSKGWRRYWPFF
jgi:hypothetical protein